MVVMVNVCGSEQPTAQQLAQHYTVVWQHVPNDLIVTTTNFCKSFQNKVPFATCQQMA